MKKATSTKTAIVLVAMLSYSFAAYQQQHFQQLYALAGGTWVMKTKKGFICEQWQKVNNSEMRNRGFRVTGKDTYRWKRYS